jgi:hypothetical protein
MVKDVKVTINLLKPVGTMGFGYPLILAPNHASEVAYKECASLEEVVKAGFAETTSVYKAAYLMFLQNNCPKKIAVCATTKSAVEALPALIGKEWRQLIVVGETDDKWATAIPAYIETTDKLYFATQGTLPESATYKDYERTVAFVSTQDSEYKLIAAAALVGATAGYVAGAITYKNIILKGIPAEVMTAVELETLHKNGAITAVEKAGDLVTSEGITGSGEYIDLVDSKDWIVQQIEYQTQKTLNKMEKVPYDNTGIAILESIALNVLKTAYNNGMIADNEDGTPAYALDYALRSESSDSDVATRKYVGGKFSFVLKGAIHNVEINGEISVA